MQGGIDLLVQRVQVAGRPEQVTGIGQRPTSRQQMQRFRCAPELQRRFKSSDILRHAGHLNDIERLDIVVQKEVLGPFDPIDAVEQRKFRWRLEWKDGDAVFEGFFPQKIHHRVACVFLLVVPVNDPRQIRPPQIGHQHQPQQDCGPFRPSSRQEAAENHRDQRDARREHQDKPPDLVDAEPGDFPGQGVIEPDRL